MTASHEPAASPAHVDDQPTEKRTQPLHEALAAILGLEPEELRPPDRRSIRN